MQAQQREITPDFLQQTLTQLKRAISQSEGEQATMRQETITMIFNNFMNLASAMFQKIEEGKVAQKTLEKIYQAHPDIKIAMDNEKAKATEEKKPKKK